MTRLARKEAGFKLGTLEILCALGIEGGTDPSLSLMSDSLCEYIDLRKCTDSSGSSREFAISSFDSSSSSLFSVVAVLRCLAVDTLSRQLLTRSLDEGSTITPR